MFNIFIFGVDLFLHVFGNCVNAQQVEVFPIQIGRWCLCSENAAPQNLGAAVFPFSCVTSYKEEGGPGRVTRLCAVSLFGLLGARF